MGKLLILVLKMQNHWSAAKFKFSNKKTFFESKLLQLNSNKSKKNLNWECMLDLKKSIYFTVSWYKTFYSKKENMYNFSLKQIEQYLEICKKKK